VGVGGGGGGGGGGVGGGGGGGGVGGGRVGSCWWVVENCTVDASIFFVALS
jgi:hypothetical protein